MNVYSLNLLPEGKHDTDRLIDAQDTVAFPCSFLVDYTLHPAQLFLDTVFLVANLFFCSLFNLTWFLLTRA